MLKNILVRLLDTFVREPRLIWRYYRPFFSKKSRKKGLNVFMVDGRVGHGGMFDRLKGAISVYAISKVQKKHYRINFTYPFQLTDYLEPNHYDWRIKQEDICYHYPAARPLFLYGECFNPKRLFKNRGCEAHFYYGYDSLDVINKHYGTAFEWGELYREVFKPTPYLQKYIDHYQQEMGKEYIVVHTRFLNLLGDKVETAINPELPAADKEKLMRQMLDKIEEVASENKMRVIMLASDSMTFIAYVQREMPDVHVVPGQVKHIDTAGETNDAEIIKMFLDYYLISGARKVYSLVGEGMWSSAFPEYAAKIGNAEFERIYMINNRVNTLKQ